MPAIAKKGILYTETPSVENRVVEGNQNPVTSGAVYKELGDTSVNNDLGANVSNQIENLHGRLTQYKVKEYTFEYTNVNELMGYNIDESNAFLDGSSYLDTGDFSLPIGFKNNGNDVRGFISYEGGIKQIEFFSNKTGTVHAFVHYK